MPARKTTGTLAGENAADAFFSEDSLKFLRGVKRNNRRDWFDPRKAVFESVVKAPMLRLIEGVNAAMVKFAPEHVRPAAKCMMRIYRDTRFSHDKTPYKTNVAAWWSRKGLEKTSGGGFYLHFSAEEFILAAGVYMPEREQLGAIRNFLLVHHVEAQKIFASKKVRRLFSPDFGVMLSRPPKGFPKDHPAMELLRCRQWGLVAKLPAGSALDPALVTNVVQHFRTAAPLVALLNQPLIVVPDEVRPRIFGLS